MNLFYCLQSISKLWIDFQKQPISFRLVLLIPAVLQILTVVGLTGYLTSLNGQRTINQLVTQLQSEVSTRVQERIRIYLTVPDLINRSNISALRRGVWSFQDFSSQEQQAWEQMQLHDWFPMTIIGFGNPQGGHRAIERLRDGTFVIRAAPNGGGRYLSYTLTPDGQPNRVTQTTVNFDARQRPWYQAAVRARKATWTTIYPHIYTRELLIALSEPVYDTKTGELMGVAYALRSLKDISKFLRTIRIGRTGGIWIMDRQGILVANSTMEEPYKLQAQSGQEHFLEALDSANSSIRDAVHFLGDRPGGLSGIAQPQQFTFQSDGERQFAQVMPLSDAHGLDWLMVIVVPESEFTGQIQANTQMTVLLCLMALAGAIAIAGWTAERTTRPLLRLSQAARAIASGNLNQTLPPSRVREIGTLAGAFNRMANDLAAFYRGLETQLVERTADLAETDRQLRQKLIERVQDEARVRLLADALPVYIAYLDREQRYQFVNRIYEQRFGLSRAQIQGQHIRSLLGEEAYQMIEHQLEAVIAGEMVSYEVVQTGQDGLTRWFSSLLVPDVAEDGQVRGCFSLVTDISDRKRAEAALRESEERFRSAFDDAAIGMAIVSLTGQWLQVNQALCEIVGYCEAELTQMTFQEITHADDLEANLNCMQQMLSGALWNYQMEKRYIHQQGHVVWALLSVSLVRDPDQQPLYFVTQVQDISDRHTVDRLKDEFIGVVSHELRTPLTAIRGALGLLASGIYNDSPDKFKRMLEIALNDSDRLGQLVNDILDLERLSSANTTLAMHRCNVALLLEQAAVSAQIIAANVSIDLVVQPISAQVRADPHAILQVLTNLLSNAIKFSSPGSTVWLSAQLHPDTPDVLFQVTDQGRGIPADKLETIFDRFQQVDVSDSRRKGGTGLGLAICRAIVQQHNGTIWAESQLGQGSRFYFTLPIVLSDEEMPNYDPTHFDYR
jgi:PAS domain S-box-containing protein